MIKRLITSLKNDESYRDTWQANIAMAFYDEVKRNKKICKVSNVNLHIISNNAAKHFLNVLIGDNK